jgi:hypothetical protein
MHKTKLTENLNSRVRLWPTAWRRTADGQWLPPIDDDWILERVTEDDVAYLSNIRTGHVAQLGTDRIHHFDREPHRDWDGSKHGLLELRVQLVLSGCDIDYRPLSNFRPRRHAARVSR